MVASKGKSQTHGKSGGAKTHVPATKSGGKMHGRVKGGHGTKFGKGRGH
jgi:hypothetical protein